MFSWPWFIAAALLGISDASINSFEMGLLVILIDNDGSLLMHLRENLRKPLDLLGQFAQFLHFLQL